MDDARERVDGMGGVAIAAPRRSSSAPSRVRLEIMKYFLPALITGIATIAVGWIKSQADLEKSKLGITGLADNYNGLVDQTKADHDELTRLRGVVDLLASTVIKHQEPALAIGEAGGGEKPAPPSRRHGATAAHAPTAAPEAKPRGPAEGPRPPPSASTSPTPADPLRKLRDDMALKARRPELQQFKFNARKAPTNFDQLVQSARR
jgi:hypothetical protein